MVILAMIIVKSDTNKSNNSNSLAIRIGTRIIVTMIVMGGVAGGLVQGANSVYSACRVGFGR